MQYIVVSRDASDDEGMKMIWKDGAGTFFNKGTNGRWRDLFSDDDLALYTMAVERTLTPDCAARWMEEGGPVRGE